MVPGASYSASGGDATSGNGDIGFDSNSDFGGINYKTGIDPMMIGVAAAAAALIIWVLKK